MKPTIERWASSGNHELKRIGKIGTIKVRRNEMEKLLTQKLYEKYTMLQRNTDKMTIILAHDKSGYHLVLALKNGDSIVPLAKFLSADEILQMEPDHEISGKFQDLYKAAQEIDTRQGMKEFNAISVELDDLFKSFTHKLLEDRGISIER